MSMFAAYVGLDPRKDINWAVHPHPDQARLLTERKIDALFCGPPESLELREKKVGHVLVSTTTDKPWSQYHCCLAASSKEFVRKHPMATKLRMIKSSPQKIIADGTDWRFLNELKKELKA